MVFIIFFLIFLFFAQTVLPTIARTLKIRERVLDSFSSGSASLGKELEGLVIETSGLLSKLTEKTEKKVNKLHKIVKYTTKVPELILRESTQASSLRRIFIEEISRIRIKSASLSAILH